MAKTVTYVIAPNGDRWGIWLDGFLLEDPRDQTAAEQSVRVRLDGIRERGDVGKLVVASEPPKQR